MNTNRAHASLEETPLSMHCDKSIRKCEDGLCEFAGGGGGQRRLTSGGANPPPPSSYMGEEPDGSLTRTWPDARSPGHLLPTQGPSKGAGTRGGKRPPRALV